MYQVNILLTSISIFSSHCLQHHWFAFHYFAVPNVDERRDALRLEAMGIIAREAQQTKGRGKRRLQTVVATLKGIRKSVRERQGEHLSLVCVQSFPFDSLYNTSLCFAEPKRYAAAGFILPAPPKKVKTELQIESISSLADVHATASGEDVRPPPPEYDIGSLNRIIFWISNRCQLLFKQSEA